MNHATIMANHMIRLITSSTTDPMVVSFQQSIDILYVTFCTVDHMGWVPSRLKIQIVLTLFIFSV